MRVNRGQPPEWYDAAVEYNKGENGNMYWATSKSKLVRNRVHASEYSSVGLDYDHYIDNNGTIDNLHKQIQSVINL